MGPPHFTPEYYTTSREFVVLTDDANDVAAIETTFNADLINSSIEPPNGDDLVWSPTNSRSSLLGLINGAKTSLITENEEMSDSDIVTALTSAASRGVDVRVVMTAAREWDTDFTALVAAGVKVATYSRNAPLYIHAKVIVADYGTTSAKVFIGSENYSVASLEYNRELGIAVGPSSLLSPVDGTLTKDFMGGTAYP